MKKRPETKADMVVEHAVRWSNNVLSEVNSNYSSQINQKAAEHLRAAVEHLQQIYPLLGR